MADASTIPTQTTFTIQEVAHQSGLSEPTLRYYEKIGLIEAIPRDSSSGHRRYSAATVEAIEALANLRASGLGIDDMRTYLRLRPRGDEAAGEQKALFETHAIKVADEIAQLQLRQRYLAAKVAYWDARARGATAEADDVVATILRIVKELRAIN